MSRTDNYDLTLYEGTAHYYSRFRPPYPPSMAAVLREKFGLDGQGRMLDLGCGTGFVAIAMAPLFEQVLAMDPQPEMLEEARGVANRANVHNIEWRLGGSLDLAPSMGSFRLVTMGNSFHWMDRECTLDALYDLTEPGGGVAIIGQGAPPEKLPTPAWRTAITEVMVRYLGPTRRTGQGTFANPPERHEPVIRRSRFMNYSEHREHFEPVWTPDTIIGNLYSMSFCSRRLLGNRVDDFERDVRAALAKAEPSGILKGEPGEFFILMARKLD